MIILSEMDGSWVGLCTGVTKVQVGTYRAHNEKTILNLIMYEVNWNCDVLNSRSDSFCVQDINAWLAIFVDRSR